ncbi:CPBP family intramembrane glutamic endopeptidase [Brevibacillus sp. SYSU BS000544]|uniref:CPBP family intramembrane glutamic endopeptidase n=1 Tax=Brevibacillus sp. SYSU BS000544 TaxID=3416443 RepID=UPI003CE590E6
MKIEKPIKESGIFTLYSILYIFIVALFSVVILYFPMPILGAIYFTQDVWYVVFVKIIFLFFIPLYIYRKLGYKISCIYKTKLTWKLCMAVFCCFIIGNLLNGKYLAEIYRVVANGGDMIWIKFTVGLLLPLVQAAIPEEIFYRYILQTRLEKVCGTILGISISAILFALFHFPSRYLLASGAEGTAGNIYSVLVGTILPVFIIGIILGFLWWRYRNIWVLIALHYGIDTLPSIASLLHIIKQSH